MAFLWPEKENCVADAAAAVDPGFGDHDRRDDMVLNGRYKVVVSAPLTAFDTPTARAFQVEDLGSGKRVATAESGLFARVNGTGLPSRDWEIEVLRELRHPHLMHLIDVGTTESGEPGQTAQTVILEYPRGGRLMPSEGARPMPLREVKRRVIVPLCGVLEALHKRDIFHRAIHPDNLFVGPKPELDIILGDCVSSVAGHDLPSAFQPLERASAAPLGCGAGDGAADIYSFGLTIAALIASRIPGADTDAQELLLARMEQGSLAALCGSLRLPREIDRLLAGMLADDPDERWTIVGIRDWLAGRHVSIASDRHVDKPKRVFSFNKRNFQNPIAIAEAFNRNWDEALTVIQSGRLEKWLAADRDRAAGAETVIALRESNAANASKLTNDALVSRVCMALDPKGPVRFRGMAVSIDAIGVMLAYAFIEGRQDIADNIAVMLDQNLPGFWIAAVDERRKEMGVESSNFIRLRQYNRNPNLSQGLERCLYDMNPSLRCLHPLIDPADRGDAAALLASLDERCSPQDDEPLWTDRHVIAYLAALLHPGSDNLLASITMPGKPRAINTMTSLAMIALVQDKLGVPPLPRLTQTAGSSLVELVETYQSDSRRMALRSAIERQLNGGDFMALLKLLNDNDLQEQDRYEYRAAEDRYKSIDGEIAGLEGGYGKHRRKAVHLGGKFAAWAALLGLLAVSFMTLKGLAV